METSLYTATSAVRIIVVHRAPPSQLYDQPHALLYTMFYDDFSDLLQRYICYIVMKLIILGDFNFHVSKLSERLNALFMHGYARLVQHYSTCICPNS